MTRVPKSSKRRPKRQRSRRTTQRREEQPDLLDGVRHALADQHPLGLLTYVSTLLCATDRRRADPFAREEVSGPTQGELIATFLDVPMPETSALLAVIAEMVDDQVQRVRIRRELAARRADLPDWLTRLPETTAYRAVRMGHVLGDGDNVSIGVRTADRQEFTCVVYIDHNMGTLVKDAFVVPLPVAEITDQFRAAADDPDTSFDDLSLADARAWIDPAAALAARTYPPFETESWPACRPLVEWIVRGLPTGGTGYQRPQWDPKQREQLADRFFGSAYADSLDDPDRRDLLDSLLWFGADYGTGDPLRWSSVRVEILLGDWLPRKIVAPPDYLAKAPELLRAFIRFAHAESGVRTELTDEALAAIDHWEPQYQYTIRSPHPTGTDALFAALGIGTPHELRSFEQTMVDGLVQDVGGQDRLESLADAPLPDEPFSWDGIPDDVHATVGDVLAAVDRCCADLLDDEYRTACRRLLARVASRGPDFFRRKGRIETAAAAVVWSVGKANDLFRQMTAKQLIGHFGLGQSSVGQRAATMLRAGGFDGSTNTVRLGSPDYLVSSRRAHIIELRDRYREMAEGPTL